MIQSKNLSHVRERIVNSALHSMTLNGIALEDHDKDKLHQLKLRMAELSTKFSNNVMDSTKDFELFIEDDHKNMNFVPRGSRELLSQQAKEKFPHSTPENGPWKITLDIPSYLPMMKHYPKVISEKNYIKPTFLEHQVVITIINSLLKNY